MTHEGDGICAVTRSTDLRRHARLLHQAHDARLSGSRPTTPLRRVVSRSWDRVLSYGVAPDGRSLDDPAPPEVVERRRAESPIAGVLPQLRASLTAVAEDAEHIMVITAADGFVLWREGALRVGRLADDLGFLPGADWTEASVGTNAIGTALAEHASVQLFSAEHFVRAQHPWTCTASPIHDPRTGEMLGVVDLSGPAPTVHPTTVALVHTAVRLAETGLWAAHETRLDRLRAVAAPLLARETGPALVVDDHGWVAAATGLAPRDRVAVPRAGEALLVHGLGACLPDRVPGGWLLRPSSSAGPGSTRLRLDLDADPPGAVVEGREAWRHALGRRHLQILALLMRAGSDGLDAAAISRALYDDADHLVTVRAELSRLRRVLGGLLAARPYRIAPGVEVVPPSPTDVARLLGDAATPLQPWP
ncbi:GAF domain-containing protein [Actinomycetospora cinnamomea]|nr:GAF domain-containing protein [Actinomycetospora cinnamomea]